MDIKTVIDAMYPYWLLGLFMIWATLNTEFKSILRIDKKAILNWTRILLLATIGRLLMFKIFPGDFFKSAKAITQIPLFMTVLTPWEDATHGLPLLLLSNFIGYNKRYKLVYIFLMLSTMVEFGLGHIYQGNFSACFLSLYVPLSICLAKKWGMGTVMVGHAMYDFATRFVVGVFF